MKTVWNKTITRTGLVTLGWLLSACVTTSTEIPDILPGDLASEQIYQEKTAFSEFRTVQLRLQSLASPILQANAELCPKTRWDIGAISHIKEAYPKKLRDAAARELDARDYPTVFLILPGSPAETAGIKPGDALIDADGDYIAADDITYENVNAGASALRLRRDGETLSVTIKPREVCDYNVRLSQSSVVNAYANGKRITFTSGMVNFAESDDELAMIIGHELAHNTMGHIRKSITNLVLSGLATRYTRPFESEADYVGLYYMVRAGYSPDGVEDFWRRLALVNPNSVAKASTHPTFPDRYLRIAATRDQIRAKKQAGQPLIPNFKKDE